MCLNATHTQTQIEIAQTPILSGIWSAVGLKTDTKRHMFEDDGPWAQNILPILG